jgi:dTDP-glucose pyrophosphorylase
MTQLLIPISDNTDYFPRKDFFYPKPLVDVAGKPMIVQVIKDREKRLAISQFIFVIPSELEREFSLGSILQINSNSKVSILERRGQTSGGLCSALMAIDSLNDDEPIVVMNMDELIDTNLQAIVDEFVRAGVDAGIITFPSTHPRWCYAIIGDEGSVSALAEKRVVSRYAVAGFYFFRNKEVFYQAAANAMLDGDSFDDNFYLSAAINQILLAGKKVGHSSVNDGDYYTFFSPESIREFEATQFASSLNIHSGTANSSLNLVIPAAGEGSRFSKNGWKSPKPLIELDGKLMLQHVLSNLEIKNASPIILLREQHMQACPERVQVLGKTTSHIIPVKKLTEGTVCTVLLARNLIDNDHPLLIANSDQIVDFDCATFIDDCHSRGLDGSILTFRDPQRDPKWSFAKLDSNGLVVEVAEKVAISDLATVGIYYFAKGSQFVSAAIDMIANNDRVNGEFYTCPVYNYMIAAGARIGVYEIDQTAMHGIGTPDDLNAFIALRGYSESSDAPALGS